MPRGRTTKRKKTTPNETTTSAQEPKRRTRRARGKTMASNGNKTSVGSKRKHKESGDAALSDRISAPEPKRQKPTTSRAKEETDRAMFVNKEPPKPEAVREDKKDTHTITHHSHKTKPGEVMTFGQGDIGQLGLGEDIDERKKPAPVGGALEGQRVVQVICGGMHTVALTDDGKVYTWGCNDEGALGRPTKDGEEYTPGLMMALEGVVVVQVSAGDCHTTALTNSGVVYCCGVFRDSNGPFGLTTPGDISPLPTVVYESPNNKAVKVASGCHHVVVLTVKGDIFTFGCAEQGQLGRVPECFSYKGGRKGVQYLLDPQMVRFRKSRGVKTKFSDVFCGTFTTFAYTQSQHLFAWGLNNYGQLGLDDAETRFIPEQLSSDCLDVSEDVDSARDDLQVTGGQHHTLISRRGSVYVMGCREYGRLGLGEENREEPHTPTKIPSLTNIASVAAGEVCSFAVSQSGDVYSWGMGTSLQLGNGEEDDIWKPTQITGKKIANRRIIAASAGGQHTALLVSLQYES